MDNGKEFDEAIGRLATGNEQDAYKARMALEKMMAAAGAPGQDSARADLARRMIEASLNGEKLSPAARGELVRLLAEIAGDPEVPTLESYLAQLELRESARYALDRIPTPAATAALTNAMKRSIGTRFRVGVAHALGQRKGDGIVPALVEATNDPNAEVRVAVAEALANHADPDVEAAIRAVLKSGLSPQDMLRVQKCLVRLGATLADAGKKADAKRVYQAVAADGPEPQRAAAKRALDLLG